MLITEGEKKALKATQDGFPCVALAGVWSFVQKSQGEEKSKPIPDLDKINWDNRTVYICYDSDLAEKEGIAWAERKLAQELETRGALAKLVRLSSGPNGEKMGLDDFLVSRDPDALRRLLDEAQESQPEKGKDFQNRGQAKEAQATKLVNRVLRETELFYDQTQVPYARVQMRDHHEVLKVAGRNFRRWVTGRLFELEGKVPGGETISSALMVIEAKAIFEGSQHELHNRIAYHDSAVWYDLADARWRAVRVTPTDWQIINDPPTLFIRYEHQSAQVEPIAGGDMHRLFEFVPITDTGARLLLMVYVVSSFVPHIPHPIPVLHGPQGSGKSSTFRILRRLIDPSVMEVLSFPRDSNELVQKLSHHWAAFFDNVANLQGWTSDVLCRAVTGEGFSKRQLFSDDDDIIYRFRRCVGLNGINVAATRPDLLDRSILIALERIAPNKRQTEEALQAAFESARPHILGAIFDVLSHAMRLQPQVHLSTLPRMADFARWGCAIAQALGYKAEDFLSAYNTNIRAQNEEVLDDDPVAAAVVKLMEHRDQWEDTPSKLLEELEQVAASLKINTRAKSWPKAPNALTRRLNVVGTNLQDIGIRVKRGKSGPRFWSIQKVAENTVQSVQNV